MEKIEELKNKSNIIVFVYNPSYSFIGGLEKYLISFYELFPEENFIEVFSNKKYEIKKTNLKNVTYVKMENFKTSNLKNKIIFFNDEISSMLKIKKNLSKENEVYWIDHGLGYKRFISKNNRNFSFINFIFKKYYENIEFLTYTKNDLNYFNNIGKKVNDIFVPINYLNEVNCKVNDIQKNSNKIKIVFFGRLSRAKNVKSIAKLNKFSNLDISFFGEGKYKNYLLKRGNKVFDYEKNVNDILNGYDFSIMLSKSEGFGLSNLESLYCRVPIIVLNSYPSANIIADNGKNGIIKNNLKDIERTLQFLKKDETYQLFIKNSEQWINNIIKNDTFKTKLKQIINK